jgi:hypothetical protein
MPKPVRPETSEETLDVVVRGWGGSGLGISDREGGDVWNSSRFTASRFGSRELQLYRSSTPPVVKPS